MCARAGNNILRHAAEAFALGVREARGLTIEETVYQRPTMSPGLRREIRVRTFPRLYSGKCHRASATFSLDVAE